MLQTSKSSKMVEKNMQLARQEMDRKVQQERQIMDNKLKQERAGMDLKLQLQRVDIDNMVREERENADNMLKQQRDYMDQKIKDEREKLDQKLKHERQEMDRQIMLERVLIDSENMQARVELDKKLQHEREYMDYFPIIQEEKPITNMVHKEIIPPPEEQEHKPISGMVQKAIVQPPEEQEHKMQKEENIAEQNLIMEFRLYVVREEFFSDPQENNISLPHIFRFMEPGKLDWFHLQKQIAGAKLKVTSDLYYVEPSRKAPDGLVRMYGEGDMDDLLRAHLGTKLCHLYLVDDQYLKRYYESDGMDDIIDDQYYADSDGGMDDSD